jgi:hypothetical protein
MLFKEKGMPKFIDLTGKKFHFLTVKSRNTGFKGKTMWNCICDCGAETVVDSKNLKFGKVKSCGCLRDKKLSAMRKTHGLSESRIYRIWLGMRKRCYTKTSKPYSRYGGRGIIVCPEWRDGFEAFYIWAMSYGYADNLSIDRIDNDSGYYPENCRWVTSKEQNNNKSNTRKITVRGIAKKLSEWSEITGLNIKLIDGRLRKGWSPEKAVETPIYKGF